MLMSMLRATLILLGTAACLGLAVLGWGSFTAFFSHPALVALAIILFALSGVAFFASGNLSPGVREDRGNRWVICGLLRNSRRCPATAISRAAIAASIADEPHHSQTGKFSSTLLGHAPDEADRLLRGSGHSVAAR